MKKNVTLLNGNRGISKNKFDYVKLFLIRESDGKILTPIRAEKRLFPNCYDFSVGGHWEEGETSIQAIRREMWEELKLKNKIEKIGVVHRLQDSKKSMLYFGRLNKEVKWFLKEEIKELCYFTIDEIKVLLKENGEKFDYTYEPAFTMLLEHLGRAE